MAFAGFYPILKSKLERLKGIICALLKLGVFNVCLIVMWGVSRLLVVPLDTEYGLASPSVAAPLISSPWQIRIGASRAMREIAIS